ncbi:putative carbonic anhydrase-like protein 2 isoform X1 [Eriocheir sinensis]|uniref:putative carbonic anhydrase-like protein 2 isoform X1 n=1 Tax=Eriocheir sinensis TaxID=95602 RepID=UPI0021C62E02|nr:putative carbonic anhydrase-like protein 2 isoform X1 [Eriocheir sinensis]
MDWSKMRIAGSPAFTHSTSSSSSRARRAGNRSCSVLVVLLAIFGFLIDGAGGLGVSWDWHKWWTYDGISGPQFWGLINPEWSLCTNGRRQSPVNLDPATLLYDPNLRQLHVDKHRVSGVINNTGHSVVLTLGGTSRHHPPINITGGPLSYRYQVSHVQLHFGAVDHVGSEHTINGTAFPAELQVYGFNTQLFSNFSEAVNKAHGVVAISVLLQVGLQGHPGLRPLTDAVQRVQWAGTSSEVNHVGVRALLPDSHHYITYDGSLTQPPCHETVTWILVNKPVYITKQQLHGLRQVQQGSKEVPKGRMVNNYRPAQEMYHRPLRTNIDFTNSRQLHCPSMAPQMYYTGESANKWR